MILYLSFPDQCVLTDEDGWDRDRFKSVLIAHCQEFFKIRFIIIDLQHLNMEFRVLGLESSNKGFYIFTMAAPIPIKKGGSQGRVSNR